MDQQTASRRDDRPDDAIIDRLREELLAIKPALPPDLPARSDFRSSGLDSLDLVEFVARIERQFSIMIADEDVPCFVSLDAVARYVQGRRAA
jgi:acyl carrier protein